MAVSGRTPGAPRERLAWIVAGSTLILALLLMVWRAGGLRSATPPAMGNAGNAGIGAGPPGGRAPDISAMSPAERFARLFDRVERAASNGDTVTVVQFAPMALGAYALLDSVNLDERFHAALIHLTVGDLAAAQSLADTILQSAPGHLFGFVLRGEVAERQNRNDLLAQSYRDFLSRYQDELRSGKPEYAEHQPILDDFRIRAQANGKP